MMKKTALSIIIAAFAIVCVQAQKFAFVDTEYLMKNIPAYESASQQLEQSSKKWQKEIDALNEEAETLYKNYQSEMVFLSQGNGSERTQTQIFRC